MKRVIYSSSKFSADEVRSLIEARFTKLDISDKIRRIDVTVNESGNYYVQVILKLHGTKIKKTLLAAHLDTYIDKLVESVRVYLDEGHKVPAANAYVVSVAIGDTVLGYLWKTKGDRMSTWSILTPDLARAKRYVGTGSPFIGDAVRFDTDGGHWEYIPISEFNIDLVPLATAHRCPPLPTYQQVASMLGIKLPDFKKSADW